MGLTITSSALRWKNPLYTDRLIVTAAGSYVKHVATKELAAFFGCLARVGSIKNAIVTE